MKAFGILATFLLLTFSGSAMSNNLDNFLYYYSAKVTSVYDGDTVDVSISLGFGLYLYDQKIRLYGINTPEVKGDERPQGLLARDWLRGRVLGKEIVLHSHKDKKGKYGRWLGTLLLDGQNINDELVSKGFAEYVEY